MTEFKGVVAATITPFDAEGAFNEAVFSARHGIQHSVGG